MSYFSNQKLLLIFNTPLYIFKIVLVDNYLEKSSCVALSQEEEADVNECLLYKHAYFSGFSTFPASSPCSAHRQISYTAKLSKESVYRHMIHSVKEYSQRKCHIEQLKSDSYHMQLLPFMFLKTNKCSLQLIRYQERCRY